jgi:hypothetical protein
LLPKERYSISVCTKGANLRLTLLCFFGGLEYFYSFTNDLKISFDGIYFFATDPHGRTQTFCLPSCRHTKLPTIDGQTKYSLRYAKKISHVFLV